MLSKENIFVSSIIVLLFCVSGLRSSAQPVENDYSIIEWCNSSQLNWEMFQSKTKNSNEEASAEIHTTIVIEFFGLGENAISIKAIFYATSWVDSLSHKSRQLLEHEQIHFNISEVVARRLRLRVAGLAIDKDNLTPVFEELIATKNNLLKELNEEFDKETLHGLHETKQILWKKRIDSELFELRHVARHCD